MGRGLIHFIIFIFITNCKTNDYSKNNSIEKLDEIEIKNSKNYALCSCLIANKLKLKDSTKSERSTQVYIKRGKQEIEFYTILSEYIDRYLDTVDYKSFQGEKIKLKIAECIDLYNSEHLDLFVKNKLKNYKK